MNRLSASKGDDIGSRHLAGRKPRTSGPIEPTLPAHPPCSAKRYVVLLASTIMQTCLGGVYAWSVFVAPLRSEYGFSAAQTQVVFGVIFAVFTAAMTFAGRLQEKCGPRLVATIGGIMFGGGYLLASLSDGAFLLILLGIGVVGGAGIGFCYVCPLATCVKWFPQSKGLVTGLAVAGFGGGAVLLSLLADTLLQRNSVLEVFRLIGLTYGAVLITCAILLRVPEGFAQRQRESIPLRQLLRQRRFWSLVSGMFCGTFSGLMVVGSIKPIGVSAGLNPDQAGLAVISLAAGNTAGRIVWGVIHDRIGRSAIPLSLAVLFVAVLLLLPSAPSGLTFVLAATLTGFGFGACFVVYAAQVASEYGSNAIGTVYPTIFLAYGLSGVLGPPIGGALFDQTGSFSTAMVTAMLVTASGIVATTLLARQESVCGLRDSRSGQCRRNRTSL